MLLKTVCRFLIVFFLYPAVSSCGKQIILRRKFPDRSMLNSGIADGRMLQRFWGRRTFRRTTFISTRISPVLSVGHAGIIKMKRFKFYTILILGILHLSCIASPLLTVFHDNGIIEVKGGNYEISFFPGCMFPFRLVSNGKTLPEPVWLDRIVGMDGKQYYLNVERFAERRILSHTSQMFQMEMTGTYCLNDDISIPGNVKVTYQYKCLEDSISVDVRITNPEKILWKEVHVLMPGWSKFPWDKLVSDRPERKLNRSGFLHNNQYVSAVIGNSAISLHGGNVTGYSNPENKYYSYLSAFRCSKWDAETLEIKHLKIDFQKHTTF